MRPNACELRKVPTAAVDAEAVIDPGRVCMRLVTATQHPQHVPVLRQLLRCGAQVAGEIAHRHRIVLHYHSCLLRSNSIQACALPLHACCCCITPSQV